MKKLFLILGSLIIVGCGAAINEMTLKERDLPSYCMDFVRDDNFENGK